MDAALAPSSPNPKWKKVDLKRGRSSNSWSDIGVSINCQSKIDKE